MAIAAKIIIYVAVVIIGSGFLGPVIACIIGPTWTPLTNCQLVRGICTTEACASDHSSGCPDMQYCCYSIGFIPFGLNRTSSCNQLRGICTTEACPPRYTSGCSGSEHCCVPRAR